jgi:glycosyltransferase involved in cell wall biosynthesis
MNEKISMVIPAYNEALTLRKLVEEIRRNLVLTGNDFEIIIVDDGSEDDTWNVIKSCYNTCRQLRGIRFTRNFGKESAICAGLKISVGAAAIVMDADLQHPPDMLLKMIDIWKRTGVHLVEAVKERRQKESCIRTMGSHIFYNLFLKTAGLDIKNSSDFMLLDRIFIDQYLNLPENVRFFRGLTKWFSYSSCVVHYSPSDRFGEKSGSHWTIKQLFDFARNSLISFTSLPLRLITWLGLITFFISIILASQTLWMKISGLAVEGFTTVILVILGIGSVIMLSLGLIGEYIARIYEEIKNRPMYVIQEYLDKMNDETSLHS